MIRDPNEPIFVVRYRPRWHMYVSVIPKGRRVDQKFSHFLRKKGVEEGKMFWNFEMQIRGASDLLHASCSNPCTSRHLAAKKAEKGFWGTKREAVFTKSSDPGVLDMPNRLPALDLRPSAQWFQERMRPANFVPAQKMKLQIEKKKKGKHWFHFVHAQKRLKPVLFVLHFQPLSSQSYLEIGGECCFIPTHKWNDPCTFAGAGQTIEIGSSLIIGWHWELGRRKIFSFNAKAPYVVFPINPLVCPLDKEVSHNWNVWTKCHDLSIYLTGLYVQIVQQELMWAQFQIYICCFSPPTESWNKNSLFENCCTKK